MKGEVIAIGGRAFTDRDQDPKLERFILSRARSSNPRIAYLPHAQDDISAGTLAFFQTYSRLEALPSLLSLFKPHTADLRSYLLEQDVIFVGGGNTRSMLALWREWGLDGFLREAAENGSILAGVSAGANCWFEQCTTDSIPGAITIMDCLGFLDGSFTPHYHGEADRRPALKAALLKGEVCAGLAVDDGAAAHYKDGKLLGAIRWEEEAQAYQVKAEDDAFVETPLKMTMLD